MRTEGKVPDAKNEPYLTRRVPVHVDYCIAYDGTTIILPVQWRSKGFDSDMTLPAVLQQ